MYELCICTHEKNYWGKYNYYVKILVPVLLECCGKWLILIQTYFLQNFGVCGYLNLQQYIGSILIKRNGNKLEKVWTVLLILIQNVICFVLVEPIAKIRKNDQFDINEPELLRALCKARKSAHQYLTQASCVARGIPVRLSVNNL